MSPFSQCSWQMPPSAARRSITWAMKSSVHMRFGRFLYVMKILKEVTPISNASGSPSRMAGSLLRMKWKPKSSTEAWLASSARRLVAWGSVSPSLYSAKAMRVVSPACAAATGPDDQSSYTAPRCTWQSMRPGSTILPVASMVRSAGGKASSWPRATMRPPWMATEVSSTSVAVTTRPPRTIVSTARAGIRSASARAR